jgi:hypothetical protein
MTDPTPLEPEGEDAGFVPLEDVYESSETQEGAAQGGAATEQASRLGTAAVLGLAFTLAWNRPGQVSPAEGRERRRRQA